MEKQDSDAVNIAMEHVTKTEYGEGPQEKLLANNHKSEILDGEVPAFTSHLQGGPHISLNGKNPIENAKTDQDVKFEDDDRKPLIYRVTQNPPIHLLLFFAIQQCLLSIAAPLSISILVSEVVCAQNDDAIKTQILCASFFMTGLSTFVMTTFGVRLPIFQGPASTYLIPLLAMSSLPEWKCPETYQGVNPMDNSTVLVATDGNGTEVLARDIILSKISQLSGSLMIAGAIHSLIGVTGLVGILTRYIGPVTIVPTIVLVGLFIYKLILKFSETSWIVASATCCVSFILSLYLSNKQTPIPTWSKRRGFHIMWYPFHQVFSVLLSILFGWLLSGIFTITGVLTDDPNSKQYMARTDARSYIIADTSWFVFPYPGKFGSFGFSVGGFISFLIASILSVLDSIGDYNASARTARVPPPPRFAFNRGIAVEGIMSLLSGALGCCHATVSYGGNIGAMGITRVVSRRVFQCTGLFYIIFAMIGKIGAVFITIPYAVLGGTSFVTMGIFVGVVMSYLQTINLNSTRNLSIIGCSLLLGLMMPYWVQENPKGINTGKPELDNAIQMLLSNPSFVGGFFACFLDNTVPGTLKERGLVDQMKELNDEEAKGLAESYEDGLEVYRFPWVPESFRRSKLAKYIPLFEYTGE